jgi:hypothetical protein
MDEGERKNKFETGSKNTKQQKRKFVDKSRRQHFGTRRRKLLTAPLTIKH